MSSLFCRHNRFTAECPICSKDSLLAAPSRDARRAPKPARGVARAPSGARPKGRPAAYSGPFVSSGPLADGREVRLEQVPGGLRLAAWRDGALEPVAPVLPAESLRAIVEEAAARGIVDAGDRDAPGAAGAPGPSATVAASPGRSGDLRDELRVELVEEGAVRVGRWLFWPGPEGGWELRDAPPMLPPQRFAEAFTAARAAGLL